MAITIDPSSSAAGARSSSGELGQRMQALHGAAARYLGMNPQALRSELDTGQSLAEITTAHGKSVEGLKNALLGALAEGGGTGGDSRALVERIVNTHQDGGGYGLHRVRPARKGIPTSTDPVEDTIAEYLGLSPDQVRQRIAEGQNVAEIAVAQGKDPGELRQALLQALRGPGGYGNDAQMDAMVDRLLNARGAGRRISTMA